MNEKLTIATALLFITITSGGQSLFFIDEYSFPATDTITLQSNGPNVGDLKLLFAKDGNTPLIAVVAESFNTSRFSEKLIIYLEDGTVIVATHRRASDLVDNLAKAIYSLSGDHLNKLKNSNIQTVRYTLEWRTVGGILAGDVGRTASNKEVQTSTILTRFFN